MCFWSGWSAAGAQALELAGIGGTASSGSIPHAPTHRLQETLQTRLLRGEGRGGGLRGRGSGPQKRCRQAASPSSEQETISGSHLPACSFSGGPHQRQPPNHNLHTPLAGGPISGGPLPTALCSSVGAPLVAATGPRPMHSSGASSVSVSHPHAPSRGWSVAGPRPFSAGQRPTDLKLP